MKRPATSGLNIYTELCPASSAAIIGAGVLTVIMGELPAGASLILTGIAIGVAGPVTQTVLERRVTIKNNREESFTRMELAGDENAG